MRWALLDPQGVVRNIVEYEGEAGDYPGLEPGWSVRHAQDGDVIVAVSQHTAEEVLAFRLAVLAVRRREALGDFAFDPVAHEFQAAFTTALMAHARAVFVREHELAQALRDAVGAGPDAVAAVDIATGWPGRAVAG